MNMNLAIIYNIFRPCVKNIFMFLIKVIKKNVSMFLFFLMFFCLVVFLLLLNHKRTKWCGLWPC